MALRQSGIVKRYYPEKGFGFVTQSGGRDLFVHVKDCGGVIPMVGDFAEYSVVETQKGPQAKAVVITPAKD